MSRKSKQARAREFPQTAREKIAVRDGGRCIFCTMGYQAEATWYEQNILSVMHYIPRAQNGLGIPENGALGCIYHHMLMDNGSKGNRKEMLGLFREYLKSKYPDWDEKKLVYSKWDWNTGNQ